MGVHHVAEGGEFPVEEFRELVVVGFEQVGCPGPRSHGERLPGGVHGDRHPVAAGQHGQPHIEVGGGALRQAAARHEPLGVVPQLGFDGTQQGRDFGFAQRCAGHVELGGGAVGFRGGDVAPGDRGHGNSHRGDTVLAEQGGELGSFRTADGKHGNRLDTVVAQGTGDVDAFASGVRHRVVDANDRTAHVGVNLQGAVDTGIGSNCEDHAPSLQGRRWSIPDAARPGVACSSHLGALSS